MAPESPVTKVGLIQMGPDHQQLVHGNKGQQQSWLHTV